MMSRSGISIFAQEEQLCKAGKGKECQSETLLLVLFSFPSFLTLWKKSSLCWLKLCSKKCFKIFQVISFRIRKPKSQFLFSILMCSFGYLTVDILSLLLTTILKHISLYNLIKHIILISKEYSQSKGVSLVCTLY